MNIFKLQFSENEIRWINLDNVSRVTFAKDDNDLPLLVIYFFQCDEESSLKIHGADANKLQLINSLIEHLDKKSKNA